MIPDILKTHINYKFILVYYNLYLNLSPENPGITN